MANYRHALRTPPTYVHVRARHLSGSRVNQAISKDFVQFLLNAKIQVHVHCAIVPW